MKQALLFFIFSYAAYNSFSQDCNFDSYQAKGGLYYMATYYQNYDPHQPMEGVCSKEVNGKPYAYREFKNGQLQVERLYQFDTGKIYSEFKRVKKDSVFAELVYKQDGSNLELVNTYYLNKEGKRCWKEENYRQGKLWQVRYFRNFQNEELVKAGFQPSPEHRTDADGYGSVYAQFGTETLYHPNGKVMSITEHQLIISDSPNYFPSQHGKYISYTENGIEIEKGMYANGQKNGEFTYHHPNGILAAKSFFENGIPVGNWIQYSPQGAMEATITYGEKYWWPTGHEKRFFESGRVSYEKIIEKNGKGFMVDYFQNGKVKEHTVYEHGPNEQSAYFAYYPSGLLKTKTYLRAKNDTLAAEFFEDGSPFRINLMPKGEFTTQEIKEYYPSHQLKMESWTKQYNMSADQKVTRYYENGTVEYKLERKDKISSETSFFSNGVLKTRCEYERDSLNGFWTEQDSSGHVLKKCFYKNGFRADTKGVFEFPSLPQLSTVEKQELKRYMISSMSKLFYVEQKPLVTTRKAFEERLAAVERLQAYYHHMNKNWPVVYTENSDSEFIYHVEIPEAFFENKRALFDSCFQVLDWKNLSVQKSGGYVIGSVSGENFYNHNYLMQLFDTVFHEDSKLFSIAPSIPISYDYDMWGYRPVSISMERVAFAKAYKITVGSSCFVVYDSGEIEPFNGKKTGYFYTNEAPVFMPYGKMYKD